MKKRALLIAAAIAVVILGAVATYGIVQSRSSMPAVFADAPYSPPAQGDAVLVGSAASNKAWYADRLEGLGFYVFPKPEALPPFSVTSLSGAEFGVTALAGKVVLLNFWATWCPPCRSEMPSIQALYEKMKGTAFDVMAVSVSEKPSTVKEFLKANPYSYPMYLDVSGAASAPFAGRGIPTTLVLDKQGRAIAVIVGSRSYDGPEVVALFKDLAERLP